MRNNYTPNPVYSCALSSKWCALTLFEKVSLEVTEIILFHYQVNFNSQLRIFGPQQTTRKTIYSYTTLSKIQLSLCKCC